MPSFNIIYLLQKLQELFDAHPITPTDALTHAQLLFQYAEWWALGISFAFLIPFVVLKLLFVEQEHRIEHQREHEEIELHHQRTAAATEKPEAKRFVELQQRAQSQNENDRRQAIIDADAMLAALLHAHGFIGNDVGEQLRSSSAAHFATRDIAAEAHGVRNRIAHDGSAFPLSVRDAQAAMESYRRVFEEFNYI